MSIDYLLTSVLILAAIPAFLTVFNHFVFRRPPKHVGEDVPAISILIPARNEEANIERAVRSALACRVPEIEVVVLDDHSTDRTAAIVRELAKEDERVRLESAPDLPSGWCGKQHACACLATKARHGLLLFIDADVTMDPTAPGRLAEFLKQKKVALVSAFPRQITGTFLEKLLIPLIEFILLGYLPILLGRWFRHPGFGAGCGQVFLAQKEAYEKAGGHAAIRQSLHDGVKLPRAFRKAGFRTDICPGSGMFTCRMYRSGKEVWNGLLKNAHEGMANPALIVPFTVLLLGGSVAPLVFFVMSPSWLSLAAVSLSWLPRVLNAIRFQQSWIGTLFHPLAVSLFLIIQWQALFRLARGKKPAWKGRSVE